MINVSSWTYLWLITERKEIVTETERYLYSFFEASIFHFELFNLHFQLPSVGLWQRERSMNILYYNFYTLDAWPILPYSQCLKSSYNGSIPYHDKGILRHNKGILLLFLWIALSSDVPSPATEITSSIVGWFLGVIGFQMGL